MAGRRDHPDVAALAALVGGELSGDPGVVPGDVRHDSRAVARGDLFVAVHGFRSDGHDHVADAIARGAAALCVQRRLDVAVPQVVVSDTRAALPILAAAVHGHPARSLFLIGVTGTNGKTTVTHMIESMVIASGKVAAVVGTVGARIGGASVPVGRTTPESSDLQRLLRDMVDAGVDVAALEVSSHALALGRVDGIVFDFAAFTNLSQDHLDFHGSMEDYYGAKARLFTPGRTRSAVVWIDDPAGRRIREACTVPTTTASMSAGADVWADDVRLSIHGTGFTLCTPDASVPVRLPLAGEFNVANALVAAACGIAAGLGIGTVAAGLDGMSPVPGRFESIDAGQPFAVIVDYAHTPEAVAAVIAQARRLGDGKVMAVLGAGGDRDRAKRPAMGAAAAAADVVVITTDNPRSEDPNQIIAALVEGAAGTGAEVVVEPDRRAAIGLAVDRGAPGDVILVLGKGHEGGQEFADVVLPFDDREVAAALLGGGRWREKIS